MSLADIVTQPVFATDIVAQCLLTLNRYRLDNPVFYPVSAGILGHIQKPVGFFVKAGAICCVIPDTDQTD